MERVLGDHVDHVLVYLKKNCIYRAGEMCEIPSRLNYLGAGASVVFFLSSEEIYYSMCFCLTQPAASNLLFLQQLHLSTCLLSTSLHFV